MIDSRLTVLQANAKHLWTARLLGFPDGAATPESLVI